MEATGIPMCNILLIFAQIIYLLNKISNVRHKE